MNLGSLHTYKSSNQNTNEYSQLPHPKSQKVIKHDSQGQNLNQSIGGKKYASSINSKSSSKDEDEHNNSFVISLSEYEDRKSYDNVELKQQKSQSQPTKSYETQIERNKRQIIYGSDSFNEVSQEEANEISLSTNNQIFEMVFFGKKKDEFKDSVSTAGSFSKPKQPKQPEQFFMKIEDFKLGKKLGAGKFGEVFLAQHKKSGFICAIKRINKSNIDQKLLIQMIRQIKIQTFLNHPNIVKLYTFFYDHQSIYLVLQLCYSGQLYDFLKKKRKIPEPLTKNIMQQTLKALDYMHQNQIIHRDLKPQNVIFQNGMIKLCDFGWSISSKTMRQTFCGTPLYVSPELLKRKNYNNKIDVWSVGILTYELLFGRVPFQITTERDFIKIIEDEIKFSKATKISDAAKQFILICLKKDPRQRYTVPELLQHPFIVNQQPFPVSELF